MTHVDALRGAIMAHPGTVTIEDHRVAKKLEDLGLIRRQPCTNTKFLATPKLQQFVVTTVSNSLAQLIEGK